MSTGVARCLLVLLLGVGRRVLVARTAEMRDHRG